MAVVDAAQVAGHVPLDVGSADFVAFTGHKGLLGPQGTGGLWVHPDVDIEPLVTGGTGGRSTERVMPEAYPDHLEAGTLNGPGIAGLGAGVRWVRDRGVRSLHARAAELKARLRAGLSEIPGLEVLSPPAPDGTAIVTVRAESTPAAALARGLDRSHGVQARAGLHCAPEVHRLLGTTRTGAVRFSLGWASNEADVDAAIEATAHLLGTSSAIL